MKKFILTAFYLLLLTKPAYTSIPIESSIKDNYGTIQKSLKASINNKKPTAKLKAEKDEKYILYNLKGIKHYNNKEYDNALVEFKKSVELKKDFAKGYNNLGLAYFRLNRLKEAVDEFKKSIECNKDYYQAYNNLGSAYLDLGDYEKALESFYTARKIYKDSKEVNANIAQAIKLKRQRKLSILALILFFSSAFIVLLLRLFMKKNAKTSEKD